MKDFTYSTLNSATSGSASHGIYSVEEIAAILHLKKSVKGEWCGPNPKGEGAREDGFILFADGNGFDRKTGVSYTSIEVAEMAQIESNDYEPVNRYNSINGHSNSPFPSGQKKAPEAILEPLNGHSTPLEKPAKIYDTRRLEERGISLETLKTFGVERFTDPGDLHGYKFPNWLQNGPDWKLARTRKKFLDPVKAGAKIRKDKKATKAIWNPNDERPEAPIYGLKQLLECDPQAKEAWIVGGETDVLTCFEAGTFAVSGFGETRKTEKVIQALKDVGIERVKIALDNDESGKNGSWGLYESAKKADLEALVYDVGGKAGNDVNDVWNALDKDAAKFREWLETLPILAKEKSPDVLKPDTKSPDKDTEEGRKSQADRLLELTRKNAVIFRTSDDEFFATVRRGEGQLTYRLKSEALKSWLKWLHFETTGKVISSESAVQIALDTICGLTRQTNESTREIFNRIGATPEAIYYDLGDASGRAIEVKPDGWKIVDCAPIAFVRPRGMMPQVIPQRGGSIASLRPFLNLATEEDFALTIAFLVGFFQPDGARPHLALIGEQGTGKTGFATALRALLDPNKATTRKEPKDSHDLMIAAQNNAILAYDNLSHLPQWLSDVFCRLATGAGDATRQLYTDDEEKIFALKRPVIFNAIHEVAARPDLLDRLIFLELPVIEESHRKREGEMWREFDAAKPLILGAIFDAVASGLKKSPHIRLEKLTRMADFEAWAVGCGFAFGWPEEKFSALYRENRSSILDTAAESSTVVTAIEQWMKGRDFWEGQAQELLASLNSNASYETQKSPDWPANQLSLGRALKRLAPVLRKRGLDATQSRTREKRSWKIRRDG